MIEKTIGRNFRLRKAQLKAIDDMAKKDKRSANYYLREIIVEGWLRGQKNAATDKGR